MRQTQNLKIIQSADMEELEQQVNQYMELGYRLHSKNRTKDGITIMFLLLDTGIIPELEPAEFN